MPDQVGYGQLEVQFLPRVDVIIQEVLVCVNRKEVFVIVEGLVASCVPFDSCGAFNTLHPCVGYCSPTPLFRRQQPFLLGGYTAESEQYGIYLSSHLCYPCSFILLFFFFFVGLLMQDYTTTVLYSQI